MKDFRSKQNLILSLFILFLSFGCKTQSLETSAPFSIDEKVYFHWVGGKQGTSGTTIRFTGQTTSLNLSFSKIFFQNHEYGVVPQFSSNGFLLEANFAKFEEPENIRHMDPVKEYGNKPPAVKKEIPFDLKDDEAILLYSVNGREGYHKVTGIKEMEKKYRP
jgi:hypothetical protein